MTRHQELFFLGSLFRSTAATMMRSSLMLLTLLTSTEAFTAPRVYRSTGTWSNSKLQAFNFLKDITGGSNVALQNAAKSNYQDEITEENVRGLFTLWNDALGTGDSRIVASRYATDAVLLPTGTS